jgi:hypothetical protein
VQALVFNALTIATSRAIAKKNNQKGLLKALENYFGQQSASF